MPCSRKHNFLLFKNRRSFLSSALGFSFSLIGTSAFASGEKFPPVDGSSRENAISEMNMQLCSAANSAGVGLIAEYFASDEFSGSPIFSRIDGPVILDPSEAWPDRWPTAVRWRGWIRPPLSGVYFFHMGHPNIEIRISQMVVTEGVSGHSEAVTLSAGRYYPIHVEAKRIASLTKAVGLEWTAPHGMKFLIPKSLLYTPS